MLDIHSMLESSPPVMISGPLDKGVRLAFDVGIPEHVVADTGHANGTRMRDYGEFGDPASPKNALLVECGQHWEKSSAEFAWQTLWRFLRSVGVVEPEAAAREIQPAAGPQKLIRVTDAVIANSPAFRFAKPFTGLEVVPRKGDVIAWDGEQAVRAPYDNCVLVMPVPNNIKTGLTAVRLGRIEALSGACPGALPPAQDRSAAGDVLALAGWADAQLLQLAVEVRALEADAIGHARHVAFLAPDMVHEVLLLELLARIAQRQVEGHSDFRGGLLAGRQVELARHAVHVIAGDIIAE
jgi:hypothetical protein